MSELEKIIAAWLCAGFCTVWVAILWSLAEDVLRGDGD